MRKFDLSKKVVATVLTGTLALYAMPVFAASKDEVVYSKINGNNEDYSTIVSDKITNDQREEYINDLSSLLNIVNTSGDETFTQDGNKIVWNANGNSLSYQGETQQDLPIKTTVTYKLNGEEVTADSLKGQDGKVSITINYENLDEHNVKINGKTEKMYTPFIVVAGLLVNKDNNENITVTKGKVVDNGKNAIAVGIALPGLQESLGLSKSDVEIPDSVTFEMNATDFEMNNIVSYVTPKLIEETDLDIFNDMDEIFEKANELQDASNQLVSGASQVNDGASQLKTGMKSALSGANTIKVAVEESRDSLANDKSSALKQSQVELIGKSAAKTAKDGIVSQERTIKQTADSEIDSQADMIKSQMVATAKQIAEETAISTAKRVAEETAYSTAEQVAKETAYNTAKQIAEETAYSTAKQIAGTTAILTTKSVYDDLLKNNIITTEDYNALILKIDQETIKSGSNKTIERQEDVIKANAAQTIENKKDTIIANADNTIESQKDTIKANADSTIDAQKETIKKAADMGIEAKKATIEAGAMSSAKQIAEETAYQTAQTVASSVGKQVGEAVASEVADRVRTEALKQVASSMNTLANGLGELTDGLEQLNTGAEALSAGTEELSNGLTEFNEDGIKKIVNYINGDVKDLKERAEKLQDLANDYNNFSGIDENTKGTVSFVIIVDNIKKDDE